MKHVLFILLFIGVFFYNLDAQSRLCPVSRLSTIHDEYYEKCESMLLESDRRGSNDFTVVIRPSFSPESACFYDEKDSVFVYNVADKPIYYCYNFAYNPSKRKHMKPRGKVTIIRYQCPVSRETAKHFTRLFTAAVLSSSYLAQSLGLDGTTYELSIRNSYYAECWSPQEGNCYELVEILHHLADAIKSNDSSAIEKMIPEVEALCQTFEGLYPDDADMDTMRLLLRNI